jgi:phytoene dehydrogenase-like protein
MSAVDAVIVGSGPNGLSAAITIAGAGRTVVVFEAADAAGGGCRSAELTLPGFLHDLCSAVHPLAVVSPVFRALRLEAHGLEWIVPPVMLAHPLDDGRAACLYPSVEQTAATLGADADAYRRLFQPAVQTWPAIAEAMLGRLRWPRHPAALLRFAIEAVQPASRVVRRFRGEPARALFAGVAGHSMLPLDRPLSGGFALVLSLLAHIGGWSFPRGGSQALTDALAACLRSMGGDIVTGAPVSSLDQLPAARAVLCDLSPAPLLRLAGDRFPPRFRRALEAYRYGMGVYKVDWALDGPVPWRNPACAQAGTVHLGGTFDDIAASERDAWAGRPAGRPFVLLSQPTLFDPSRAPRGAHVVWSYCHVPHGSPADMLPAIEQQIERFAPGFRRRVIARSVTSARSIEQRNANMVGGDIGAGAPTLGQFFTRPTWRTYSTPLRGLYICSAATPPGPGVHGLCGYFAARRALREVLRD